MGLTREQEAAYALDYGLARDSLKPEVQVEYDRQREARQAAAGSGTVLPKPTPRFPSSSETRRQILQAIAGGNEKYARPFDKGRVALASLFGTESWADYGNVVLQMAILDTLLSIEEKLGALMGPEAQESGEDPPAAARA